jgi:hypothetical protein
MFRFLLSLLSVILGTRLVTASQDLISVYSTWGVSHEEMLLAGWLQIMAAIFLWFHRTEVLALVALWSLATVAIFTHWRLGHEWSLYVPGLAMSFLILLRATQILQRKSMIPFTGTQADVFPQQASREFELDEFNLHFYVRASVQTVADYLNRTQTFTQGQIPPYRVEFIDPQTHLRTERFEVGILTNHFGPLLNLPGKITQIEGSRYRELVYGYGSYAISNRLFRPEKLQFWFDPDPSGAKTKVHLRLTTSCRWGWKWLWRLGMWSFWPSFVAGMKLWSRLSAKSSA